jgi:predicted dehydrogenase
MSKKHDMTRRAFLMATTTTAVGLAWADKPNTAKVVPRKISPNEKINIAAIGCGGKGMSDIMGCKHENIIALCDPDWDRAGEAFYRIKDAKRYKDYRKMLEEMDKEIDACIVSTPDHTHAPAAYHCMMLGKHVYVQKPLTHTIAEARFLDAVAKETGVITQMGNQGHCGDGVRELCEMLWSGAIGEVREAHIWTNRPIWPQGIDKPLEAQPVPETMDWDLWIGTAPMRDYNKGYAPFNWRGWWDYGCGAIGDMACHIMDPAFWSLKLIEAKTYTVEVVQQEGMNPQTAPTKSIVKFEFPERAGMPPVTVYWYDGGLKPERPADIPEGQKIGDADGQNGSLFIGSNGYLTTGTYGGGSRILPDERMKEYQRPDPTIPRVRGENPYRNWTEAMHEGKKAESDFSYASKLTEVANFGNVALHAGKKLEWDVEAFKITNDKDANQLLTKEYRKGWELPIGDYVKIG